MKGGAFHIGSDDIRALRELSGALDGIDGMISAAINRTADWAQREAVEMIESKVAFPANYLVGEQRLRVYSSLPSRLSAVITARFRSTQLSRFATNLPVAGKRVTPRVQVSPGRDSEMRSAFFMKLKRGTAMTGNVGIAMREEAYDKYAGAGWSGYSWEGVKILYGPSVSQVFSSYASDSLTDIGKRLVLEFNEEVKRKFS
ncbi:hypothetical protein TW83_09965 [Paracoccus sp. S4493]|uniref:hypothetical protein n=1 Tax=Paracoccus sp. S4493 TaxID=579490 RepID=UPI0005F9F409|nr:hypothetical protein [Paracoccus sp. S4493]KJZ31238.1 hypothetical protein TW83_09965 [Paracoccus sp. S4493]